MSIEIVSAAFDKREHTSVRILKRMKDENPSVFASGYLIFRREAGNLQFLLMKHTDRWDLPKGHVDPDETISQAAVRELYEETGIPPDAIWTDPEFAFVHRYQVDNRKRYIGLSSEKKITKELTIFLGFLLRPISLQCTEHPDYRWWNWAPPHRIQKKTIDPLLASVQQHLEEHPLPQ